jgi:hypothetical protein
MAAWQFTVCLIPKSWATSNAGDASLLFSVDGFDSSVAWTDVAIDRSSFDEAFDKVLNRSKTWHVDQTAWGDEERIDIQLWVGQGRIEEIQLRLNLREALEPFVSSFCEALEELDCVIFVPETKRMLPLEPDEIVREALASRAATFVKDPHTYLSKLAGEPSA